MFSKNSLTEKRIGGQSPPPLDFEEGFRLSLSPDKAEAPLGSNKALHTSWLWRDVDFRVVASSVSRGLEEGTLSLPRG